MFSSVSSPKAFGASVIFSRTLIFRNRLKFWNTIPTFFLYLLIFCLVMSSPLYNICPPVGVSNKFTQRNAVLFPLPLEPKITIFSPFSTLIFTPFNTSNLPNFLCKFFISNNNVFTYFANFFSSLFTRNDNTDVIIKYIAAAIKYGPNVS